MKLKPKPCPFCGGKKIYKEVSCISKYMACLSCGAEGPTVRKDKSPVYAWNRRSK